MELFDFFMYLFILERLVDIKGFYFTKHKSTSADDALLWPDVWDILI